jgi:hypothetical protein
MYRHPEQRRSGINTGPMGNGPHVVQPGECFLSIAHNNGFFWQTLWNLPANRALRDARKDPGQLLVGDRVVIPEREIKELPAQTDARHDYVKRGCNAKLRLIVEYEDVPVANADYILVMGGVTRKGTTDENGLLVASIPPNASQGFLDIDDLHFDLQLGALNPHSEDAGIQHRLANLGFYQGEIDGIIGPMTREALSNFQSRTGLPVTGQLDDDTRQLLLHRHDEVHDRLPQPVPNDPPAPEPTETATPQLEEAYHG